MAAQSGLDEAMAAQMIAQQTLAVAKETEKRLDAELAALNSLDEKDIER